MTSTKYSMFASTMQGLREAVEYQKSDTCVYCSTENRTRPILRNGINGCYSFDVYLDPQDGCLVFSENESGMSEDKRIAIEHCPMCGRKL